MFSSNDKTVSIAMATYNGERFLREQLDSLLNQTYRNLEIIICDDCSTDSTAGILSEYAKKDSRLSFFVNEKNLGFKKNFEKAIGLCKGEFIALSDQDDIWEANKIEMELKAIGDADFVFHDATLIGADGENLDKSGRELYCIPDSLSDMNDIFRCLLPPQGNFVQGSTMFAKTDFLKSCIPIPTHFKYHDWWFTLNSIFHNRFIYLPVRLMKYRRYAEQVTAERIPEQKQKYPFLLKTVSWYADIYREAEEKLHILSIVRNLPLDKDKAHIVSMLEKYYKHSQKNYVDGFVCAYFIMHYKNFFPKEHSLLRMSKQIFSKLCSLIGWFLFRPYLRYLQKEYNNRKCLQCCK